MGAFIHFKIRIDIEKMFYEWCEKNNIAKHMKRVAMNLVALLLNLIKRVNLFAIEENQKILTLKSKRFNDILKQSITFLFCQAELLRV